MVLLNDIQQYYRREAKILQRDETQGKDKPNRVMRLVSIHRECGLRNFVWREDRHPMSFAPLPYRNFLFRHPNGGVPECAERALEESGDIISLAISNDIIQPRICSFRRSERGDGSRAGLL